MGFAEQNISKFVMGTKIHLVNDFRRTKRINSLSYDKFWNAENIKYCQNEGTIAQQLDTVGETLLEHPGATLAAKSLPPEMEFTISPDFLTSSSPRVPQQTLRTPYP